MADEPFLRREAVAWSASRASSGGSSPYDGGAGQPLPEKVENMLDDIESQKLVRVAKADSG